MAYTFNVFMQKLTDVENWLTGELSGIRSGQATPAIVDKIMVESYGQMTPIKNMAHIHVEGARSLKIEPWDKGMIKAIEKAITVADLGLSVGSDEGGVRATFPELTAESREKLLKIAKQKLEEARISIRKERENVWEDIQKQEKEGKVSEDEKFSAKDVMQKHVDEANAKLDTLFEKKEKELLG